MMLLRRRQRTWRCPVSTRRWALLHRCWSRHSMMLRRWWSIIARRSRRSSLHPSMLRPRRRRHSTRRTSSHTDSRHTTRRSSSHSSCWASWILYKLHELGIAVGTSLERSSVLDKIPKETCLHSSISLTNDIDFRRNDVRISIVFTQGLHYGTESCCKVIAAGVKMNLKHSKKVSNKRVQ